VAKRLVGFIDHISEEQRYTLEVGKKALPFFNRQDG
jgi:hypothetical protein